MTENGTAPRALTERPGRPMSVGFPSEQEWTTITNMAGPLVKSGLLPSAVNTEAKAVAIMLKGRELGLPPMYALSNINVIQGKPVCNAELMLAIIYRDLGSLAIINETPEEERHHRCVLSYTRPGWSERKRHEFTWDDAIKANLVGKDTWKAYPDAMLRARCISAVARMAFPDLIGGLFTAEELESSPEGLDTAVPAPAPLVGEVIAEAPGSPAAVVALADAATAQATLRQEIKDLCGRLLKPVPHSLAHLVKIGTSLGLPEVNAQGVTVEYLEQIKARLEQQENPAPARIGCSTGFVEFRAAIERAETAADVVEAIDAAMDDERMSAAEYQELESIAKARREALPEPAAETAGV